MSEEINDPPEEILQLGLEEMRQQFYAGDRSRLIAAIRYCGRYKLVMPEWVVDEFHKGTNDWFAYRVKEIGESLDLTWKETYGSRHINALKKRRSLKHTVYFRVRELHADGMGLPISDEVFDIVGKELNIGKTLASEYYYAAKQGLYMPAAAKALLEPFRKK